MNYTYDIPLLHSVTLGTAQSVVSVPGKTSKHQSIKIIDALGFVGTTPAAVVISIGDGVDQDRFGTINIAAGGTANNAAAVTLNLTDAAYELNSINDLERLVFTNTTVPSNSVSGLEVVVGYY